MLGKIACMLVLHKTLDETPQPKFSEASRVVPTARAHLVVILNVCLRICSYTWSKQCCQNLQKKTGTRQE